jgi:hypothetical protein
VGKHTPTQRDCLIGCQVLSGPKSGYPCDVWADDPGGLGGRRWAQWAAGAPRRDIICTLDNVETEAQRLAPVLVTCHYWPSVTCYHTPGATGSINWAKENVSAAHSLAPCPGERAHLLPCNVRAVVVTALLLFTRDTQGQNETARSTSIRVAALADVLAPPTHCSWPAAGSRAGSCFHFSQPRCLGTMFWQQHAQRNKLQCGPGVGHLATGQLSACGR